jgi:hypothetical protein
MQVDVDVVHAGYTPRSDQQVQPFATSYMEQT